MMPLFRSRRQARITRRPAPRPLLVETLEERCVPAGNLLVSVYGPSPQNQFREYTPAGGLIRSVNIPQVPGATGWDEARHLVIDPAGKVSVYNGTFNPYLATYDPNAGSWSQTTYSGWSTVNNVSYGGLARFGSYIFATDMNTGGGAPNGIVRFDTSGGATTRF